MESLIRKTIGVIVISLFAAGNLTAQLTDMGRLLSGGADDGGKLLEAYLAPFPKAFGATLNAGWYNTAKPHSFPGFDLSFSFNVAFVPDDAKFFDLKDLGLSNAAKIPSESVTPTFSGPSDGSRPMLRYTETLNNQEVTLAEYTLPEGTGIGFIPAPTLQLGVGVPFGTDIIGRYTPEINLRDAGNMGLWGFGIKHSIDQWIPGLKRLPILNLSLMAGYTKFYTSANVSILPGNINAIDNTSPAVSFDNQKMDFGVGSFTANIVVSADIPFFTAYGGLGINSTTTNLKMSGWYPVPVINQANPVNMYTEVTDLSALKDPVDFSLGGDYKGAQPRATAGVKLKLSLLQIHFDYTYSNYSVVTGGLGISFR
jgi:hypothetical protein